MSLFGNLGGSTQQQTSNLFNSTALGTNAPTKPWSFADALAAGNKATQQQQQPQPSSIFAAAQPAQIGGLFGATQPAQNQGGGLFGASQPTQAQGGLFGSSTQPQHLGGNGLFGNLGTSTAQQQPLGSSILGASQQLQQQQPRPGTAPLWQQSSVMGPREKTVIEQMAIVAEKWNPDSPNCAMQYYFYNTVPPDHVPYYTPEPGEDEKKWEEALSKKPSEGSIPVLGRGFYALGHRLRTQVQAVTALQTRLHEINNSLTAMLQNHDLVVSVRAVEARRKHVALSRRCLALATKVQVLRNRGYAMDSTEEELKKKLIQLETGVFDPALNGREEEIWARMVGVRERARFLQDESDKIGKGLADGQGEGFDEDIMLKTKKILGDYDAQIAHLKKELDQIRQDYEEWQSSKKPQ